MDVQRRHLHADGHFHAQRALIGAVLALLVSTPALAQVGAPAAQGPAMPSIEVSPLRVELTAAAGSTTTQAITVSNAGAVPVRVRARLSDWDLSRDGAPQFEGTAPNGPFSATSWVRVAPPEVVIEPAKQAVVRFSLAVPQNVTPGGYRAGVLFEFGPATGDPVAQARSVQFKTRIATLIYVSIGQPPMAAEITDLRQRTSGGQLQLVVSLKNTSRRYVRTKGTLIVYDQSGNALIEAAAPDAPLLPESERDIAIVVLDPAKKAALPPGEYRVEVKLDLGLPALVVGETTIKVPK